MVITVTDKKNPTLNEVCVLIGKTYESDKLGNQIPKETETEIFCGELAVPMSEFYAAAQTGIRPEMAVIVNRMEYDGQRAVSLRGIIYDVVRCYPRIDEFTELYLQRK